MTFPILGGNGAVAGAFSIDNSLRFNDDDSAKLSRTPSSASNRKTWTWSGWVKRSNIDFESYIISAGATASIQGTGFYFIANNKLRFIHQDGSTTLFFESDMIFRDVSAWYHMVVKLDTTQANADNRLNIYINGNEISGSYTLGSAPSQNYDLLINNNVSHSIGARSHYNDKFFDGYMADVHFIDGTAKAPTDFGEFDEDSGIWKPIRYSGSYGTNGFKLNFSDSGSLGADSSGNGNDFTATNLASTDQMLDTPTNNFATLNPLNAPPNKATFSEGNLKSVTPATGNQGGLATQGVSTGKWYAEFRYTAKSSDRRVNVGQARDLSPINSSNTVIGDNTTDIGYRSVDGKIWYNSGLITYGNTYDVGDIIGVALDLDNGYIYFSKNNTWQNSGNPTSGSSGTGGISNSISIGENHFIGFSDASGDKTETMTANYGQDSSFAGQETRQNNSDDNGFGDFYYSPPSGYLALCTQNLATELSPTIDDGSAHFHTQLYTGNGTARTITNDANAGDFQPDWVWVKHRNNPTGHSNNLVDSSRGGTKTLYSNSNDKEETITNGVTGFATDGFTLGNNASINENSITYKAWQWKANAGTTSSNTDGDITTTVQANTTSGFSILTWTGNGSASQQLGHGLGTTPKFFINKNRDVATTWQLFGSTEFDRMQFNTEAEDENLPCGFSSTTITLPNLSNNTEFNSSGDNFVSYVISEVEGFSRIGTYFGNGVTGEGSFVYCGFKPQFLMIKSLSASSDGWAVFDSARDPYNGVEYYEFINNGGAEGSGTIRLDFLSNGFKLRQSGSSWNGSNVSYFFYAIASNPFVTSSGIPNTAR